MEDRKKNSTSIYLDDETEAMVELLRGKTKKSIWITELIDREIKRHKEIIEDLTTNKMDEISKLLKEHGEKATKGMIEAKYDVVLPPNFFNSGKGYQHKKSENSDNSENSKQFYEGDMKRYEG